VYVWKDRGLVRDMLARASSCGYAAIVLTADTPVLGRRERDVRRGFTLPPTVGPGTLLDGLRHPGWTWDFLRAEPIVFANVAASVGGAGGGPGTGAGAGGAVSLAEFINEQFEPSLSWTDLEWIREAWTGPVVLKGVQRVEDARTAASVGVEAVALSNHGGRQLDGAPPPVELLQPVLDAVGDRLELICDGGVRRGSDIVKALALGARAVMAGRAYLYGLGAGGEWGVDQVIALLDAGTRRTMALAGCRTVDEIGPDLVRVRGR
jgi:L-lactate dehydrogenase (cytochrome)